MDLLTTILACSVYVADDDLVRAIAESTPERNPYSVVDAGLDVTQIDPPPAPTDADSALARARSITAQGGRVLLGLLQLPPGWLDAFGRPLSAAFDPCTNIAIGSAMLSAFDAQCARAALATHHRSVALAAQRSCVLRKYQDAIGSPDFALTVSLELRAQRPARLAIAEAPIVAPEATRRWGPEQLLVPLAVDALRSQP